MQRFTDADGGEWEVTVGRASWGAFLALFVPLGGGEAREASLAALSADAAGRELLEAGEDELASLFRNSGPRTP